jgi:hypothetical protein
MNGLFLTNNPRIAALEEVLQQAPTAPLIVVVSMWQV